MTPMTKCHCPKPKYKHINLCILYIAGDPYCWALSWLYSTSDFLIWQWPITTKSIYSLLAILMIYTLFGINAPEGANKTLITLITHTHLFSDSTYLLGQGKLRSMCRELTSTSNMGGDQDSNRQPNECKHKPYRLHHPAIRLYICFQMQVVCQCASWSPWCSGLTLWSIRLFWESEGW